MLVFLAAACLMTQAPDPLARSFRNPPSAARPHTWWHWMDGNVTREGITADLEAMKQAGIGGAHIFDVGQGVPAGPVQYNSKEWQDLMVHAITEAGRVGLDMTMHNCAGWSSSGAPWVQPDDAMKKVVSSVVEAEGSAAKLPQPQTVRGYYRDISIHAFPSTAKAGTQSINELTGLGANPGPVTSLQWPVLAARDVIDIPLDRLRGDGTLDYPLPPGKWTVLRMGYTLTGAQNVASRDSGRGLEVDKLSAASLDNFLEGGLNPLLNRLPKKSALSTVLVDSYETGYNNWTPGILEEFQSRRGYDPRPFLPSLAGYAVGSDEKTLGFLFDYRKTIAELWSKNYSGHFADRLKERDLGLAIEPYGNGNIEPFTFAKPASLIMGEYWVGDTQINVSVKHAASIAHVYGHSVVGAEALTAMPDRAGWRNQPRQWKPFADQAMTLGINRIIYHRFAHQPWAKDVLPGMTMGPWGSHVDRTNTFWSYMPAWNEYVSRCQFMLQSGKFVGDILLFSGEDTPQSYAGEGQSLPEIPAGYDYDFCGPDPLMSLTVKGGRLTLPNGASYALLALPKTTLMTLPLARKIAQLVADGAIVVGPKPTRSPSLAEADAKSVAELKSVADKVWGNPTRTKRVFLNQSVKQVLSTFAIQPDFSANAKDVRAIHRRIGALETYFVASSQPYPRTVTCRFRVDPKSVKQVELWHPETGRIEDAPIWTSSKGIVEVPLSLQADGSVFVVLRPSLSSKPHLTSIKATLAATVAKPKPRLQILKATYGDAASGQIRDVTRILAGAAGVHSLRIGATNTELGGDPAVNIVKTLTVTYKLGDEAKTAVVTENQTLSIGDLPDAGSPPAYELVDGGRALRVWQKGKFALAWSNGRTRNIGAGDVAEPRLVTGPWNVRFPAGWEAPPSVTLDKLISWSDHTDFGVQHFSGTATYTKTLNVDKAFVGPGKRLMLDLGDVRELCRIRLNGKHIATLWKPPFRVDITDAARPGQNQLEVQVTNLWVNRLIGDEQFPDDMGWNGQQLKGWPSWFLNGQPRPEPRRKTFTTWRHNTKDTPLLPSGLLGPVLLRPVRDFPLHR